MKAFMTARKTCMQIISFKQAPQDNEPTARIEKKAWLFLGSHRKDHVSIADMGTEKSAIFTERLKRLAARTLARNSALLSATADWFNHKAGNSSLATPMRDHASLPDPSHLVFSIRREAMFKLTK